MTSNSWVATVMSDRIYKFHNTAGTSEHNRYLQFIVHLHILYDNSCSQQHYCNIWFNIYSFYKYIFVLWLDSSTRPLLSTILDMSGSYLHSGNVMSHTASGVYSTLTPYSNQQVMALATAMCWTTRNRLKEDHRSLSEILQHEFLVFAFLPACL